MAIPTLDFAKFHSGSDAERREFASALTKGFKRFGFIKLINHGFTREETSHLFQLNKDFFELPDSYKDSIQNKEGPKPQRGWSRVGAEKTGLLNPGGKTNLSKKDQHDLQDAKEHFDTGPAEDQEYPNQWPDDERLPGFRPWLESYFDRSQAITLELMEALELGLGIRRGAFVERCQGHASELRLNHYPAIARRTLEAGKTSRIWPHTDFGIITLLAQDDRGGLEIQNEANPAEFVPVPREDPTEFVVNIGDTLERWTNGVLHAGLHQVTAPRGEKASTGSDETILPARRSIAFFLKARRDMSVGPLLPFVTPERPSQYQDMTALAYQQLRTGIVY
ncbi:isopenicillin N synthase family dioxygenase [Aspergillus aculeatinus CBS 121060]|uniref:Gibberellin 20-oxidase n=1 Tax=Aspergillus aculeatinus CBS 121060 TaxID=1448322 RepID=A0ACD1H9B3_9EURO|nr:putative gibberellin 20-oxidase [Aspergillus aculeatinus CBS 121060]RAH70355.1 putative gibberellin 20-oxidase [Aspergillus aculeatinus CBS 121060]